ncbi:hypothetical protein BH10ACT11_BH10ACT11_04730 [soil metagenome]
MSDKEPDPDRRKASRRGVDRRVSESATAKLAVAPSDHGFSIDQPYVQRQLIVVVPNEVLMVEPQARESLKKKANAEDRAEALLDAVREATGDAGLSVGVEQTVRGVMALREAGIEIRMVAAIDAAKQLALAPGHPFHGTVYAGHPGIPNAYYPLAEFHQRVFEHKFDEAIELIMALGASHVQVERDEGFGDSEAKALAVAFSSSGPVNPSTGFKAKSSAKGKETQPKGLFEATFPGSDNPSMPKAMVWWKSERSWQTLARARIRHHTAAFSLTLRYENDYGVNNELRRQVEAAGLEIGGRFHPQVNTVWTLHAEFPAHSDVENGAAEQD